MGYLFIICLILVLATFLAISMQCVYKRIKKKANQALIEAKMFTWGKN